MAPVQESVWQEFFFDFCEHASSREEEKNNCVFCAAASDERTAAASMSSMIKFAVRTPLGQFRFELPAETTIGA